MNPATLFDNVLRTVIFGMICGVVFTVLFMLGTYSIDDTQLRAAIIEERIMNYIEDHPDFSLLETDQATFEKIVTSLPVDAIVRGTIGVKIIILDSTTLLPTKDIPAENPNGVYPLEYPVDSVGLLFPVTTTNPNGIKSNFMGSQTFRAYVDPVTKKIYLLEFQVVVKR